MSPHRSYVALVGSAAWLWSLAAEAAPATEEKVTVRSQETDRLEAEMAKHKGSDRGLGLSGSTAIGGYGDLHHNNLTQ